MLVVNPETVTRQQQLFEPPEKTKVVTLDEKMKEILSRQDITDEEKVKLYENALSLFSIYREKATTVPRPAPSSTPIQPSRFIDDVIASVPKALRGKAEQLTKTVLREMAWSQNGELMVDDRPVPGTHIVDLINDAVRMRKSFNPIGRDEFVQRLSSINVPQELIGNPAIWERLQHAKGHRPVPEEEEEVEEEAYHPTRWDEETPMYESRVTLSERVRRRDRFARTARWLEYPEN